MILGTEGDCEVTWKVSPPIDTRNSIEQLHQQLMSVRAHKPKDRLGQATRLVRIAWLRYRLAMEEVVLERYTNHGNR